MKSLFTFFTLTLLSIFTVYAQARDFDGIWSGTLETSNGDSNQVTIYIQDNNVYSVYIDEDGDRAKYKDYEVIWSKGYGQQLNFVWMDKGGVWTETQMFSLVWSNHNKLSVYHIRHISNQDDDNSNTDWGYMSEGYFYKE